MAGQPALIGRNAGSIDRQPFQCLPPRLACGRGNLGVLRERGQPPYAFDTGRLLVGEQLGVCQLGAQVVWIGRHHTGQPGLRGLAAALGSGERLVVPRPPGRRAARCRGTDADSVRSPPRCVPPAPAGAPRPVRQDRHFPDGSPVPPRQCAGRRDAPPADASGWPAPRRDRPARPEAGRPARAHRHCPAPTATGGPVRVLHPADGSVHARSSPGPAAPLPPRSVSPYRGPRWRAARRAPAHERRQQARQAVRQNARQNARQIGS